MARILNGFVTTSGARWFKKEDSAGRTYYHKEGEGRVASESFAAAKKHFKYGVDPPGTGDDLPPELRDAGTIERLKDLTNIPFDQNFSMSIQGTEAESLEARRRAEGNRFYAFYKKNDHLSRREAAKEYLKFRREISEAPNQEVRAIVRQNYNLGGS